MQDKELHATVFILQEKHSFIYSMNNCLLTTYYVPNTIQGIGDILANKQAKNKTMLPSRILYSSDGEAVMDYKQLYDK